jgi:hypothetical protein
MENGNKFIWSEMRDEDGSKEIFYLLAEKSSNGWKFFERSSWELRWYAVTATEQLVARVTRESKQHFSENTDRHLRHVA